MHVCCLACAGVLGVAAGDAAVLAWHMLRLCWLSGPVGQTGQQIAQCVSTCRVVSLCNQMRQL